MSYTPYPQTADQWEAKHHKKRTRELEWLAREVAEELLLDVPVGRIADVAESLDIKEPDAGEVNTLLAMVRHATVRTHIPAVGE